MSEYLSYIEKHQERFLEELKALLRIPSISADRQYAGDVREAAQFVKERLDEAGVQHTEIMETEGHPIVYGDIIKDPSLPTVLVYGHYDVQPPDPLELWDTPPFEPEVRDNKIYARGAADDKGQMYMHVKAVEALLSTTGLPVNVRFMIEGEEEVGSANLEAFVEQHREKFAADIVLISDTGIISNEHPSITTGLRGLCYMEVTVTGPNRDLHSGMYGGMVANPANVLCEMIASLHDEQHRVTIDGFYDDVIAVSDEEREEMTKAPFDEEAFKASLGIDEVHGESGYSTRERVSIRPTLDVNGMWSGYTGEGAKTVLPSTAHAKISMRLVPGQRSEKIAGLFEQHIKKIAPPTVKVDVMRQHGGEPAVTPIDSNAYQAASKAFETVWGKKPFPVREGGSIPIVELFERLLDTKTVLLGFGLDEDAIHSPNESYGLFNYYKGIETICSFYQHYATLGK